MERFILASGSPRRSELLSRIGLPFEVLVSGTDESQDGHEDARQYARAMSLNKAMEVAGKVSGDCLVLAADTVVAREGHILGKPADREDAARMLRLLSNGWHEVITGLTLVHTQDMTLAADALEAGCWPLDEVDAAELPRLYGYVRSPQATGI